MPKNSINKLDTISLTADRDRKAPAELGQVLIHRDYKIVAVNELQALEKNYRGARNLLKDLGLAIKAWQGGRPIEAGYAQQLLDEIEWHRSED